MYSRPIVSPDFTVPLRLDCDGFHLRMLTVDDLVKDYDAIMASRKTRLKVLAPGSKWPEGLTLTQNLIDLGWHQREFMLRHSFAYTVMNPDECECLGCCYIYPSDRQGYDVMAAYWGRGDRETESLEDRIGTAFREWLKRDWPFTAVAFPGRDIGWDTWMSLAVRN